MKYLCTLIVLFLSLTSFAQNEHPEQKNVEEVARHFIKLILVNEFDQAIELSMPSTAKTINQLKEMRNLSDEEQGDWNEKTAELRKAQIIFSEFDFSETKTAEHCKASFVFSTKPNKTEEIMLTKVDGKWLADMERESEYAEEAVYESAEEAADAVVEAAEAAVDAAVEAVETSELEVEAAEEVIED